ncbi:hypothetical protein SAMN03159353_10715 [Cedecea sp. NFIX57]|nr:hypothetical protein SAMN03159353_10715 [Cedecea sp. NFIX57]
MKWSIKVGHFMREVFKTTIGSLGTKKVDMRIKSSSRANISVFFCSFDSENCLACCVKFAGDRADAFTFTKTQKYHLLLFVI